MRKCVGQRILLTVYTFAWVFLLLCLYSWLCEGLNYYLVSAFNEMGLPLSWFTQDVAIPLIGGLGHENMNWLTYLAWGLLWGWPLVNLVFVWWCKDPGRMRRGLLYSYIGYGIFFFAVVLAIGVGLSTPFMYWGRMEPIGY